MNHKFGIALAGLTLGAAAFAQTKWDLPTAYPASNFHIENITQFASDVDKAQRRQAQDHRVRQRVALQGARDQARRAGRPGPARRNLAGELLRTNGRCLRRSTVFRFLAASYDAA